MYVFSSLVSLASYLERFGHCVFKLFNAGTVMYGIRVVVV